MLRDRGLRNAKLCFDDFDDVTGGSFALRDQLQRPSADGIGQNVEGVDQLSPP